MVGAEDGADGGGHARGNGGVGGDLRAPLTRGRLTRMATTLQPFLNAVSALSWSDASGGSLVDSAGAHWKLYAAASTGHDQPWGVVTATTTGAYAVPHAAYATLKGGGAQSDGSFADASGALHWLGVNASGTAVACESHTPPPPPPP